MTDLRPFLQRKRIEIFNQDETEIYLHTGYFIHWFSAAELNITMLLARAVQSNDLDSFELLVKGMDARVKCERLRKACGSATRIGPNLQIRLQYFENTMIPLRNKLTHSYVVGLLESDEFHFATLGKMPYAALGLEAAGPKPPSIKRLELFEQGLWLHAFSRDLIAIFPMGEKPGFEIDNPQSPAPPEARPPNPRKDRRAKSGKPPQS